MESGLPDDLMERSVRRLGQFASLGGGLVLLEAVVSHFIAPAGSEVEQFWDHTGVGVMVLVSFAAAYATLRAKLSTRTRTAIGVVYLVAMAFLVSVTDHADQFWRGGHRLHGVPSLSLLILAFPVLVPMRARTALLLGTVMAAMGPLAVLALVAGLDFEPAGFGALVDTFPWLAGVGAAFLAHIVHGLGVEVRRARQLGAYDLEEVLGGGGMGEVWRARHRLLARPAAIKLIRPELEDPGAALERFQREAHATAALRSPHTIEIYDYGVSSDGRLYYAMELLDGVDLRSLVESDGPQPYERVVFWLRQACHSLHEAHQRGLVHRDIKPANLFVCRYGEDDDFLKVLDFGLVAFGRSTDRDSRITGQGKIIGTPAFMSPELAISGVVDARADLYALGCVAYFLLSGQLVFQGGSPIEVIVGHVERAPPRLAACGIVVPDELEQLIADCLAKKPDARPASAAELMARLDELDLVEPWTPERARAWWNAKAPRP